MTAMGLVLHLRLRTQSSELGVAGIAAPGE